LPSVIDIEHPNPEIRQGVVCPLAQTLANVVPSTINFNNYGAKLYSPVIYFGRGPKELRRSLRTLGKQLKVSPFAIERATRCGETAMTNFYRTIQARGREIMQQLGPQELAMVIVSRPYNGFDPGVNLNLPRKLRQLGQLAIPMDFLPLDEVQDVEDIKPMYWRYGQKILSAAELIRNDPRLQAIYVTNFGCGPDSFIQHFFKDKMRGKPYLEIEIDEHSSDVGAVTRLEAFMDSLKNVPYQPFQKPASPYRRRIKDPMQRKIFLPPMTDHALALVAAFQACGVDSEALPESDEETLILGRKYTSGKECYPCILTTGDMVKMVQRPDFDPEHSAFFMPSGYGPCRFGQYHRFQRLILDELGYAQVPIYAPDQSETMYEELGMVGRTGCCGRPERALRV